MALTKEQAMAMIREARDNGDTECAHADADDALCGFLEHLGHSDLVEEYLKICKWYA